MARPRPKPRSRRAARARSTRPTPPAGRARAIFWPFGLFGNPGAEAGVHDLADALTAALNEHESEPGTRQHRLAATTDVEVIDFLEPQDYVRWREDLRDRFEACLADGDFPLVVGGNHLVALPIYEAYAARRERVCVVLFDAHLDAYDLAASKERLHHGNFLLHLARGPRLAIVALGHRDLTLRPDEVAAHFARTYPIGAIAARPIDALVAELRAFLAGFDRVHIDIDLDVLDPGTLRAVGSPMPCGLSAQQLVAILDGVWSPKVGGISLSEYDAGPDRDGDGRRLVLWLMEYMLLKRVEMKEGIRPRPSP